MARGSTQPLVKMSTRNILGGKGGWCVRLTTYHHTVPLLYPFNDLTYWNVRTELKDMYTGCPRRNVPDFGRVFLMLKYTDITQNTYVQSWTVTEIKAREKFGLLAVPRTVPGSRDVIPISCAMSVLVYSRLKRVSCCDCTCKVLGNPKDNYDMSVFL